MRKKCLLMVLTIIILLTGCAAQTTFETVLDALIVPAAQQPREIQLSLPEEATFPTLSSEDSGSLYICDGYTIAVQTLEGGDMDATLRQLTGFGKDALTVMETENEGLKRVSCVWSAAGENGDHVGRAMVLDDGSYHYAVSVMAEFSKAGELSAKWKELFASVSLSDID